MERREISHKISSFVFWKLMEVLWVWNNMGWVNGINDFKLLLTLNCNGYFSDVKPSQLIYATDKSQEGAAFQMRHNEYKPPTCKRDQ